MSKSKLESGEQNPITIYTGRQWTSDPRALLYLPDDYDANEDDYPVIVFFRGGGEAGSAVDKLLGNGIPKLIEEGVIPYSQQFNQKFIVVSPQARPVINQYTLNYLFDSLQKYEVRIDYNRIYFTGLSRGAAGALSQYLNSIREGFKWEPAAAVIMSTGMAFYGDDLSYMKDSHFWFFIGDSDSEVGTEKGQLAYNQLVKKYPNGDFKLTVYKGGHGRWNDFYNPKWTDNGVSLYDWMLEHELGKTIETPPVETDPPSGPVIEKTITKVIVEFSDGSKKEI